MVSPLPVFVDSMVWIAFFDNKHDDYERAQTILGRYLSQYQKKSLVVTDYIFDEILSYITRRQKDRKDNRTKEERIEFVRLVNESLYHSIYVKIQMVSPQDVGTAFRYMLDHPELTASLTDWISLIVMKNLSINAIVSFDNDIKSITGFMPQFKSVVVWDR